MRYFILKPKLDNKEVYIETTKIEREIVYKLIDGELINNINLNSVKLKNITKRLQDLMGTGSSELFFSDEMKIEIEKFEKNENLNFLSAIIKKKQYWLLNTLNNVECFDWGKSEYTTYDNPKILKKVTKFVLKGDIIKDRNIFRIAEEPIFVFISEKLKESFEELNFTGLDFDSRFEVITI